MAENLHVELPDSARIAEMVRADEQRRLMLCRRAIEAVLQRYGCDLEGEPAIVNGRIVSKLKLAVKDVRKAGIAHPETPEQQENVTPVPVKDLAQLLHPDAYGNHARGLEHDQAGNAEHDDDGVDLGQAAAHPDHSQ